MNRRRLFSKTVAAAALTLLASGTARARGRVSKVVLIGIDGVLYSKIEQANARNLLRLSAEGLLSRSSIAPHTSISGPSWTTVLTGVWDRKHGITGNHFDDRPFAKYPTVFTQLQRARPDLKTHCIATWDMIAVMAGSGDGRADVVVTTAPVPDDPDESRTDAATAAAVVTAITKFAPDFLFTHLDQVDHAGHFGGGARSGKYLDAITRVDELVGRIVAAVAARAAAEPGESWTILVTTDHGHTPKGGHGGQSADETATFVIARGPDFPAGVTTTRFCLADITPTVLALLGAPADPAADGSSMIVRPSAEPIASR
ncbi:alkaline phosphatase family protein [Nocardia sp. NPDC050710]|uniref:alkaline phosphatase family protein n=1 Tax=Nocardia sp. NPDC050710 TaxID=3157220 RepID=UPI0033E2CF66